DRKREERKEKVIEIKTKNGKTITIKDGGKLVACEDCLRSHSFGIDIILLDKSYKYRCKKCGFKGECEVNDKIKIGKEHLDNSPSCSKKEKNSPQFIKCSDCQQEKNQEEIEEMLE